MTDTQKLFIRWNAERLGLSIDESTKRYLKSWDVFPTGHMDKAWIPFENMLYNLLQVFCADNQKEMYHAIQAMSLTCFLRRLAYPEYKWKFDDVVIKHIMDGRSSVDILDYGCGLAQRSRSLALFVKSKISVRLTLVDLSMLSKDFLLWIGNETGIETKFLDVTPEVPLPCLPSNDVSIVTEFFEHVYNPLLYFHHIHNSLKPGGIMVTNLRLHEKGVFHVTPVLDSVRKGAKDLGYIELIPYTVFKKKL